MDNQKSTHKNRALRPHVLQLPAGEHFICQCGRSVTWPFCDGTHKGGSKKPYRLMMQEPGRVALCSCGHSGDKPFCDGSHAQLTEDDT